MIRSVVTGTGSALPVRRVSNAELARQVDTTDEWIVERTGIRFRHIAGPDETTATLAVDEWYAGDEASTVTVEAPSQALEDLLMAVDFQEGSTYLVSATDDRVTLCGFTAETSPELEAMYAEAFPAQG